MKQNSIVPPNLLKLLTFLFVIVSPFVQANNTFNQLESKYTLITAQAGGKINQPLTGFWWWEKEASGHAIGAKKRNLFKHTVLGNYRWLIVHSGGSEPKVDESIGLHDRHFQGEGVPGILGQYKKPNECFAGLIRTVEVLYPNKQPDCPQYYWWQQGSLCVNEYYDAGQHVTLGYKHDDETCGLTNHQIQQKTKLTRFLGAAFAPIAYGKYIHTVTVAAPAQFLLEIKFAWDYRPIARETGVQIRGVKVSLRGEGAVPGRDIIQMGATSGTHVFQANRGGAYHFLFEVYDINNQVIHMDQIRADLR